MSGKQTRKKENELVNSQGSINLTSNIDNLRQKNIAALRKRYPEIWGLISKVPKNNPYERRNCSNKLPNIWFPNPGFLYYNPQDPIKDVEEQLAALKLKNVRMAIFLGMGLAYEVFFYVQKVASSQLTNHILILEKDPYIFMAALNCVDLTPLLEHPLIHFMVGVPEEELFVQLKSYLKKDSKFMFLLAMKPVYHISSLRLHKSYYLKALQVLRDAATHQVLEYGNSPKDSLIGLENMLDNLEEIVLNPGINLLLDKFRGRPAVVVSTGPSLNKNKHLLKGLEDKALIIAADASLRVLIGMGVKPHLVTALERTLGILPLLEGFTKEQVEDVYLAACPVIDNKVYQAYPGPRVIVYRNFDHFRWLDIDKGILDIQMSAGNMSFKIAQALGCDPIILIGQDLAFGDDGSTHAQGSTFSNDPERQRKQKEKLLQSGTREVRGNIQEKVFTSTTWYNFLKAYEVDIASHEGLCINSTEGGAYINGTTIMPFSEAINQYVTDEFQPMDIIKDHLAGFNAGQASDDTEKTITLIENTLEDLQAMYASCQEGKACWRNYKTELEAALKDMESLNRLRPKLNDMEVEILAPKKECYQRRHTFQLFFAHIFQSYAIKFDMDSYAVGDKYDDPAQTQAEILLRQIKWYEVIGGMVDICIKSLEKAKDKLIVVKQRL
ncbi:MAG: 6-hydroxymethylpterin diphosphokinase MptE-like protein [Syntrophomonas sp.]